MRKFWPVLVLIAIASAAFDVYGRKTEDLRNFDPKRVAQLETSMWRSYYDHKTVYLFAEMGELLRTQYHFPFLRSNISAYRASKAALVFKDGHARADYERALPDLVKFYGSINQVSVEHFDVNRAARLELDWWIIHRERSQHDMAELVRSLAELQAEIYHLPPERFQQHAKLRAEAMLLRDMKAASGGVKEQDWIVINELLRASWYSLWSAVNSLMV